LLGYWLLVRFLEGGRYNLLVFSGVAFGLAYMCRYAGAAFIGGTMLVLLLHRWDPRRKLTILSIFVISAAPFVVPCILRNAYLSGAALSRQWGWHVLHRDQIIAIGSALSSWLVPTELPIWVRVTVLGVALVVIATSLFRLAVIHRRAGMQLWKTEVGPVGTALLLAGSYEGLLFLTAFVFDPGLDMGIRMHAPAFVFVLLVAMQLLVRACQRAIGRADWSRVVYGGSIGILILSYASGGMLWMNTAKDKWLWYSTRQWRNIPEMVYLKSLNAVPIYSNAPDFVYYVIGNTHVYSLPKTHGATPIGNVAPEPNQQVASMLARLRKDRGVVVCFRCVDWRRTISDEELQRLDGLSLRAASTRAALYAPSD